MEVMDKFADVPERLYSWIPPDYPYKLTNMYQIKYWWQAFSDLYKGCSSSDIDMLRKLISSDKSWKDGDDMHPKKLDWERIGQELIKKTKCEFKVFRIACRCCFEEKICDLVIKFNNNKEPVEFLVISKLVSQKLPGKDVNKHKLDLYWLQHFSEVMPTLTTENMKAADIGLLAALEMNQLLAIDYFWKFIEINYKTEPRLKEKRLLNYSVTALGYENRPELFEYFFNKLDTDQTEYILRGDLSVHKDCRMASALLKTLRFKEFKIVFDFLKPEDVPEDTYCKWLQMFGMQNLPAYYMVFAVKVFTHVWESRGFASHRSAALKTLTIDRKYQESILVPLIKSIHTEVLWTILEGANPSDLQEYMRSDNAQIIGLILHDINITFYHRFWGYQEEVEKKVSEELFDIDFSLDS